jgi:hypothetical protein
MPGLPKRKQSSRNISSPAADNPGHYSAAGNAQLAKFCMRLLWLREHQWPERLTIVQSIHRFLDEGGHDPDLGERLFDMIDRNQKVRQLHDGDAPREGEIEVIYRPLEFGVDAPRMRFVQKI